jgi:hypothetical protein
MPRHINGSSFSWWLARRHTGQGLFHYGFVLRLRQSRSNSVSEMRPTSRSTRDRNAVGRAAGRYAGGRRACTTARSSARCLRSLPSGRRWQRCGRQVPACLLASPPAVASFRPADSLKLYPSAMKRCRGVMNNARSDCDARWGAAVHRLHNPHSPKMISCRHARRSTGNAAAEGRACGCHGGDSIGAD